MYCSCIATSRIHLWWAHHTQSLSVQVQKAVVEANVFSLVSHIWWGVWAILQVCSEIYSDVASFSWVRTLPFYASGAHICFLSLLSRCAQRAVCCLYHITRFDSRIFWPLLPAPEVFTVPHLKHLEHDVYFACLSGSSLVPASVNTCKL